MARRRAVSGLVRGDWYFDENVAFTWSIGQFWLDLTIPLVGMADDLPPQDCPLVIILLPTATIDFSDPVEGFSLERPSPLVATVYADDAMSIRHTDRWRFIIDVADDNLGEHVLGALERPNPHVVLLVTFEPMPEVGNLVDYLQMSPTSIVPLVDGRPRRDEPPTPRLEPAPSPEPAPPRRRRLRRAR